MCVFRLQFVTAFVCKLLTLPELCSSYVLEGLAHIKFCASWNWVWVWLTVYLYARESGWNPTQIFWNQIGHSMTTSPQMFLPSSILVPPSLNSAHISSFFYFPGITWVRRNCITLNFISEEVSVQGCYFLFLSLLFILLLQPAIFIYLVIHAFIYSFVLGLIKTLNPQHYNIPS